MQRFSNELDFTDKLIIDCFENLDEIKRMVVREFEDYNISKMVYALNIFDKIKLLNVTDDLEYHLERSESLRSVIF